MKINSNFGKIAGHLWNVFHMIKAKMFTFSRISDRILGPMYFEES